MTKTRKRILKILLFILILFSCLLILFNLSKSRTFQLFGEVVSSVPNNDKKIALTFDDGPTENTSIILDKLSELNIKATFFLCGTGIEQRPDDAKLIVASGNAVGNHSYSHTRMIAKSYGFIKQEVDKTNSLISKSGYTDTIFFRPPYGKKLFFLPYYLSKKDIVTVMWSMEPETVLGFDATAEEIARYVIDNVKNGSIILLHPMYNPDNVLPALDIIVPELKKQGYTFCTIPQLYKEYK
ncbi:MAG: polysaccharide deacetylase family protein [Eubacteriaceae bacterium]|nr:polysaccharide deacetylase family protein [Eubacteriaceae bacterium]